jgi:hypothetical protein
MYKQPRALSMAVVFKIAGKIEDAVNCKDRASKLTYVVFKTVPKGCDVVL